MKIHGTIELVGCREISAEEYCSWHQTGRFQNYRFEVEKHTWVEVPNDVELYCENTLF